MSLSGGVCRTCALHGRSPSAPSSLSSVSRTLTTPLTTATPTTWLFRCAPHLSVYCVWSELAVSLFGNLCSPVKLPLEEEGAQCCIAFPLTSHVMYNACSDACRLLFWCVHAALQKIGCLHDIACEQYAKRPLTVPTGKC